MYPALNKLVDIALKLDDITDIASDKAVRNTVLCAIFGVAFIIFFISLAWINSRKTSKKSTFEHFGAIACHRRCCKGADRRKLTQHVGVSFGR